MKEQKIKYRERGATMVEFSLSAGVFITFLVGAIQLIHFGYVAVTTQHALNKVARWSAVQEVPSGGVLADRSSRIADQVRIAMAEVGRVVEFSEIAICPVTTTTTICSYNSIENAGAPREFVQFRVITEYGFIFGLFNFRVEAISLIKNEPFRV